MGNGQSTAGTWDLPEPFWIRVAVDESDIDRLGHVNNAVYLAWCERVAWEHATARDAGWELWQRLDRAMAILSVRLDYLAAALAGDELLVGNWIARNDARLRATRRFQILRPNDGRTLLRGEIDYVCIEISSGRPRRFPAEFVLAYGVLPAVEKALAAAGDDPREGG